MSSTSLYSNPNVGVYGTILAPRGLYLRAGNLISLWTGWRTQTLTVGANVTTIGSQQVSWRRINNIVEVLFNVTFTATANGTSCTLGGLPLTSATLTNIETVIYLANTTAGTNAFARLQIAPNSTNVVLDGTFLAGNVYSFSGSVVYRATS